MRLFWRKSKPVERTTEVLDARRLLLMWRRGSGESVTVENAGVRVSLAVDEDGFVLIHASVSGNAPPAVVVTGIQVLQRAVTKAA